MSAFIHTIDAYWYHTTYDFKRLWQRVTAMFHDLTHASYALILSNTVTGLVVLQLAYILPFSQIFSLRTTIPTQAITQPVLAKTAHPIVVPPLPTVQPAAIVPVTDLQVLVNKWAASHRGSYGIMVRELGGKGGSATYNASKQFVSASIYKLYVSYAVYTKMAAGAISGDSLTSTGSTVNYCLNVMIVRSDNACAHALLDKVGGYTAEAMSHQRGYKNTFLASKPNFITTAADTSNLLTNLQSGTLIRSDYRDQLLGYMGRQIYRSGIPAGSQGHVADKVGFIESYNHDAAIVYGPKSTYVLTVLSSGSSFTNIADLARQISQFLNK